MIHFKAQQRTQCNITLYTRNIQLHFARAQTHSKQVTGTLLQLKKTYFTVKPQSKQMFTIDVYKLDKLDKG